MTESVRNWEIKLPGNGGHIRRSYQRMSLFRRYFYQRVSLSLLHGLQPGLSRKMDPLCEELTVRGTELEKD